MRMLNEQELEVIEEGAPEVFDMVEQAKRDGVSVVILMLDAFGAEEEANLLQNVIWYFTQQGLAVTFCPEPK